MNAEIGPLKRFNDLTNRLWQALNQKNFEQASLLALKQNKLINKLAIASNSKPLLGNKGDWEDALKRCQKIREALESELKKLSTDTRNTLKRFKGYSR